ncbi:unnamed protein product [Prorocentrum cordatum]|uniref:Uncharacterized protein n=1 Tax=Prorocentrum cordatum TaxID=2364126 RepID=A0ABN9TNH0_9DINO|nr:unnamed protein product [Polarella glacialis]
MFIVCGYGPSSPSSQEKISDDHSCLLKGFFEADAGLPSRFPQALRFKIPDLDDTQCFNIFARALSKARLHLDDPKAVREIFKEKKTNSDMFNANGRSVENLLGVAVQAYNLRIGVKQMSAEVAIPDDDADEDPEDSTTEPSTEKRRMDRLTTNDFNIAIGMFSGENSFRLEGTDQTDLKPFDELPPLPAAVHGNSDVAGAARCPAPRLTPLPGLVAVLVALVLTYIGRVLVTTHSHTGVLICPARLLEVAVAAQQGRASAVAAQGCGRHSRRRCYSMLGS